MKYIFLKSNDPFINIATEEFLAKNIQESIFLLYINKPCVIIGKNQNPHQEVDLNYLKNNNIELIRRNSGGGAVYQDLGNLNFSFILKNQKNDFNEFKKLSQPIVYVLNKITNQEVYFSGRNDLLIDDKKISGIAQMVVDDNLVHHGTILFNSDFSSIDKILLPNSQKIKSKGVKSVISRVTNLKEYINDNIDVIDLVNKIINEISSNQEYLLNKKDLKTIDLIAKNKREQINFLINNKIDYQKVNSQYFPGFGTLQFSFNLDKNNLIKEFVIHGEHFTQSDINEFANKFINIKYTSVNIKKIVEESKKFSNYFNNLKKEDVINLILKT